MPQPIEAGFSEKTILCISNYYELYPALDLDLDLHRFMPQTELESVMEMSNSILSVNSALIVGASTISKTLGLDLDLDLNINEIADLDPKQINGCRGIFLRSQRFLTQRRKTICRFFFRLLIITLFIYECSALRLRPNNQRSQTNKNRHSHQSE